MSTTQTSELLNKPVADIWHTFALPCCGVKVWANAVAITQIVFTPRPNTHEAVPDHPMLKLFAAELEAYLQDANAIFSVPYALAGTVHQQQVWRTIASIPAGGTLSYQAIADTIGSSARAVGTACGKNPVPLLIPCHRVIKKNGELGGFNQQSTPEDLHTKTWLLMHEAKKH